jgi:hypothetical protein
LGNRHAFEGKEVSWFESQSVPLRWHLKAHLTMPQGLGAC